MTDEDLWTVAGALRALCAMRANDNDGDHDEDHDEAHNEDEARDRY